MLVLEFYKYMWKSAPVGAFLLTMLMGTCVFAGVVCMYAIGGRVGSTNSNLKFGRNLRRGVPTRITPESPIAPS